MDEVLAELLELTGARATGLWRLSGQRLFLLGFRGVADMPEVVKREFAEATRAVPLTQTGLGIVKAALSGTPALSSVDAQPRTPATSAGWLERFGAHRSVAVPVADEKGIVGVLAISTARELQEDCGAWQILCEVSEAIGGALSAVGCPDSGSSGLSDRRGVP